MLLLCYPCFMYCILVVLYTLPRYNLNVKFLCPHPSCPLVPSSDEVYPLAGLSLLISQYLSHEYHHHNINENSS
ncbi:hypothetical protein BT96DRAFT_299529 [Gymnopus androsaceus JB14]|uniref:Uncharacterized protein n=1 Tax=Gymnopus androsaceus JB14 TaxID=1447944 RepID=A0A6A4H3M8_9AGAR|nr:hypothetical protein BT96DRAFT_299529 [Gymnopus androsaceus JB14]